jgi:hypothetical protein
LVDIRSEKFSLQQLEKLNSFDNNNKKKKQTKKQNKKQKEKTPRIAGYPFHQ